MASTVDIRIKAKDEASGEIKKVGDALTGLKDDGGAASEKLGGDFDTLVAGISAAVGIAVAVIASLKEAIEFSQEGAAIVRLQDSSASLAESMGLDMDEIVAAVSAASLGTVSDLDIIASASKALLLGVGTSAEQMASLMEIAIVRGRAMGLSVTDAFDQIIRGIGRQSPKILDNLGIIIDLEDAYEKYAESIGKSAGDLTEFEQRQAMVNAVIESTKGIIEQTGGVTLDAAAKWERAGAIWKNVSDKIKAGTADVGTVFADLFYALGSDFARGQTFRELKSALDDAGIATGKFQQEFTATQNALGQVTDIEAYNALIEKMQGALDLAGAAANTTAEDLIALSITEAQAKDDADKLAKSLEEMALADITSLDNNFKGIIKLGESFTDILEDITEQEKIMAAEPTGSEKWVEAKGKIDELKAKMTELANQVTLDMFAATIAIGGVTEAELGAYFDMAIAMGTMSEEGAAKALEAYGNAIETINGYTINNKEGSVTADITAAISAFDFLEQYKLLDKEQRVYVKTYYGTDGDWYENNYGGAAGVAVQNFAQGGVSMLPHMWVGERGPEPFFPATNGRIVSNTQAMAALRGGAGVNADAIADAVKQGVKEAMRDTRGGNVYNLTMPTSVSAADVRTAFELMEAWNA